LTDFRIEVTPEPAGMSQYVDAEGNSITKVWFDGLTDTLVLQTRFLVRTLRTNPFEFLLDDEAHYKLPIVYRDEESTALVRYCTNGERVAAVVANYTLDVMEAARGETLRFLHGLNQRMYEEFRIVVRVKGPAYSAEETLSRREVACRDVANLFVECARVVGLAARFVSGYQAGDPDQNNLHMHAWAEVYLPGAGWVGYDPTHGLAVADGHVAVAAAPTPAGAAALSGSFRGTGVESTVQTSLTIDASRG